MHKNEKSLSLKNIKIKEDLNRNKKYTKINHKILQQNKSKIKNNQKKNFNKLFNKEKAKSQKLLNGISKISKKVDQNNRNLNNIDITMNFNLTNFTTYNDTNKILDKKFIENYSGKKESFHKRQISDGFQKIKVFNTQNFLNIKVNTKGNKTSSNKEMQNIKKLNLDNKSKIFKNKYINYEIGDKDEINNVNNFIYNSHKDLTAYENISKLNMNISDLKLLKELKKNISQKMKKKIVGSNSNKAKSAVNLKKKEKMNNVDNHNNNIPINKKKMKNNKLISYKTFKNSISESKKILKTEMGKKILKEKIENNKNNTQKKYDIFFPSDKVDIYPLYINTNTSVNTNKKNIKRKIINNSCDGLNNNKGKIIFKKNNIISDQTSKNNTNRGNKNYITDKNKITENESNIGSNKDKENIDNPETYFFNIVQMIQKCKNSVC